MLATLFLRWSAVFCPAIALWGAEDSFTRIRPLALQPGRTNLLVFEGSHSVPESRLWTSFLGISAPGTFADDAFRIALPSDTPLGLGIVQVWGTNGVSPFRLVLCDPLPTLDLAGTNDRDEESPAIPLNTAVEGECDEGAARWHRLRLRKRARVMIEVVAHRLGSPLDPLLLIVDSNGKELQKADDTAGCEADARLVFSAPRAGDYWVGVRDTRYLGGSGYRYRLRILDNRAAGEGTAAAWAPLRLLPLADGGTSGEGPLATFEEVEIEAGAARAVLRQQSRESAPDPTASPAIEISPPLLVRGQFGRPGDRDVYQWRVQRGQRWRIQGRTRSLGSPCDLYLALENTGGSRIAEANVSGPGEGDLIHEFKEDTAVRLVVEELNHGGGANSFYELEIAAEGPGFELDLEENIVVAKPGDKFEIQVKARRRDYDGPIRLELIGGGHEIETEQAAIPEKKQEGVLSGRVPDSIEPGQRLTLTVVGRAEIGGSEFSARAGTGPALRAQFPTLLHPPKELDGLLILGIGAR